MEQWQSEQIVNQARNGTNIIDAGWGTKFCPSLLDTAFRSIDKNLELNSDKSLLKAHQRFRVYLHPETLTEFGSKSYFRVYFKEYTWMPRTEALIIEPNNLVVRPFTEDVHKFAQFIESDRVWLIINFNP